MGSIRFPNKVMQPICGTPMIGLLLQRLSKANNISKIVLATSEHQRNDTLSRYVCELGYTVYKGSEDDVLDRFYQAAKSEKADVVVRITGDCPLVDSEIVDNVISIVKNSALDYASNTITPTFPDGLDVEVFTFESLERAWRETEEPYDREHVTPYIKRIDAFNKNSIKHEIDCSDSRWTVDEQEDFDVIKNIFEYYYPDEYFSWQEVLKLQNEMPHMFVLNQHLVRNEGGELGAGQKLWRRAKRVIPGGNMLLSKRAEMFLPNMWPSYFSKAKECYVWDLDGKKYIDMSIMGIGTNVLGYGHPEVDEAVQRTILAGNMSTLNCPEEVYLAEKLVELHPWSDMVRFARTGGEANAIAIRIARASSGKDAVAICGYHGWHDWYLAANLGDDKNLAGHLLPGLDPLGVPKNLRETIYPFTYNHIEELEALIDKYPIGVIKMEVSRNERPKDNFLQKVRQIATKNNIVLIFDECTSGFRESLGGLHKNYDVEPDMAIFGKALGNGYAITATIGRREIMDAAQSTFISSTFWTERIGPSAALATLDVMERIKSYEQITKTGNDIAKGWENLAKRHGLDIKISGLPSMVGFNFTNENALAYKTLITQEMLKKGYLASTSVYTCIDHSSEIVDEYLCELDSVFELIQKCENGQDVNKLLKGPVCHAGFKRLN